MSEYAKDFIQGVVIGAVLMYSYITVANWYGF